MTVVVLTRDLMDGGRFRTSRPDVVVVRSLDAVPDDTDWILLDLAAGIGTEAAVALGPPVIAYGPHVDDVALEAARAAGCVDALPRSKVFRRAAELD